MRLNVSADLSRRDIPSFRNTSPFFSSHAPCPTLTKCSSEILSVPSRRIARLLSTGGNILCYIPSMHLWTWPKYLKFWLNNLTSKQRASARNCTYRHKAPQANHSHLLGFGFVVTSSSLTDVAQKLYPPLPHPHVPSVTRLTIALS